ncbi:hypothetical protein ACLFMI_04175 [Pseudonocardia nantongensis]|uniref:hypothetical protein n=1 Tax=Pseudonocardia nantongensis TaxID=1181885 RepID=UPI00397E8B75
MTDRPSTDIDDEPPASAADAMAIIQSEQARQEPNIGPYFLLWGAAWVFIGLAWFGAESEVWAPDVAGITTGVLVLAGCAVSAVLGARMGRGVAGPSSRFGAMYGFGWFAAMAGTGALAAVLATTAGEAGADLIPALFVFVVGVMYTVTGAFHRCIPDYALGLVVQAVAVTTAFTPGPWNTLVMGIGGGGALVAMGIYRGVRR